MSLIKILDCYERSKSTDFLQVRLEELTPSELTGFHTRYEVHLVQRRRFKTEDEARAAFEKALGKKKSYNSVNRLS